MVYGGGDGLGVWRINQRKDLSLFKNILLFLTKINFKRVLECSVQCREKNKPLGGSLFYSNVIVN